MASESRKLVIIVLLIGFSVVEPDSFDNLEKVWGPEANLDVLKGAPVSPSLGLLCLISSLFTYFLLFVTG